VVAALASDALLSELDLVEGWSTERWGVILDRITSLFISDAGSLAIRQIELFDDVFMRLMDRVDAQCLVKLSQRLSHIKRSPPRTTRRLALDANPLVSISILRSRTISQELLLEAAQSQGLEHLRAIAARHSVDPPVCAALVQRGDAVIHHLLARNLGARLFEPDWARLVRCGESDTSLSEILGRRSDIPPTLKSKVRRKLEDAQMRSLHAMPRVMRDRIETTVATTDATEILGDPEPLDYASAQARMVELNRKGKLNDSVLNRFAIARNYSNVIAALAFLSGSPIEVIEPLIASDDVEGLVIACKASRLNWSTTSMIVRNRPALVPISSEELEKARKTFESVPLSAAQRIVRF
jgi:uncharacterized protein (DUF2336 family)